MSTSFATTSEYLGVSLLAFVPGIVGLAISIYMWFKIPRTFITMMFLIFVISCLMWQISDGFLRLAANESSAFFWNRCVSLAITPTVVTGFHFTLLFTGQKKILQSKLFFLLVYCPAIYFFGTIVLNLNEWQVLKVEIWNWISNPDLSPLQTVEIVWIFCLTSLTLFFLAKYAFESRKKDRMIRLRSRVLFLGYLIPALIGLVCQIIFPQVVGLEEIPIAAPAIICFSIASLIALKNYKLFSYSSSFPANRILEIMNEAIVIVDLDFKIRYANCAFSRLVEYSQENLIGMPIEHLGLGNINPNQTVVHEKLEETDTKRSSRRIKAQDGSEQIVFFDSLAYIDKSGDITGTILLFTDITEIVNAKEKIKEEKLQALQYQSMLVSAQLNPHFIYNSLNSIQYYVLDENREIALNYISDFSKLMRDVLNNSLKINITLFDEIRFLQAYINLEIKRLRNKFTYVINVSPELDVDDVMIPPMLLQPYIENSIVHGIGSVDYPGILTISFTTENERVICEISDNGIGRKHAMKLKENGKGSLHKSHGMNLTKTRIDILNEINQMDYVVEVEDLKDANNVDSGTKIMVSFPLIN